MNRPATDRRYAARQAALISFSDVTRKGKTQARSLFLPDAAKHKRTAGNI